ncbi:MAG: MFS transporter [Gammaproteobacteria bacterium]|nr:MFS transporter [Gammaproteobacteria bacterium]
MTHTPLPRSTLIYYALPELTQAVVTLPMALFVPAFYTDDLGLPLAGVGAAIAASRLLDVVVDPVVGMLSDRTRTRWGRRKPWIAAGTPALMLSAWMVFAPPAGVSLAYLFVWASVLFLAFTLVDLPHKVWGAELSTDYLERNHVAAWREGFGGAGLVLFLATLLIMGFFGHTAAREQLWAIGLIIVLSLPPLVGLALRKVPEARPEELIGARQRGWPALRLALENRAFRRTMATILLFGTAVMIQATLHRLVLTHVIGRPELFAPLILAETLASLGAIPFWLRLAARFGKHRAVTAAALWVGFWSLGFPLLGAGDIVPYAALIILRGSSLTSIFLLSNSIAADVVDQDVVESGRQRTGLFFAVWGMAVKGAVALGVLLATALPAAFGFEPALGAPSAETTGWLLVIYGWLPCLIMVLGVPLLWHFPIDRRRHKELRDEIAERRCP